MKTTFIVDRVKKNEEKNISLIAEGEVRGTF
jgi:hypothetical protein